MNKEKNDPHLLFWGSFEETLLCIFSSKSEKNLLVLASEYHVNWGLAVTYCHALVMACHLANDKSLREAMKIYCQLHPEEYITMKFDSKCKRFHSAD